MSDPVDRALRIKVVPRWVAPTFVVLALLTVPWIAYLAMTLPARTTTVHYRGAWVGFDIGLVVLLGLTAYLAWRGSRRLEIVASATATTLAIDAWFDVSTTPMPDLVASVLLAVLVELPLAAICLWIALHTDALEERRMRQLARRAARAEETAAAVISGRDRLREGSRRR
ncbi:MAG TPA: hypothetical protein VF054_12395 [Micromonosporaceae bacterium]